MVSSLVSVLHVKSSLGLVFEGPNLTELSTGPLLGLGSKVLSGV